MDKSTRDKWQKILYQIYRTTYILSDKIDQKALLNSTGERYNVTEFIRYLNGDIDSNNKNYGSLNERINTHGTCNLFVVNAFDTPEKKIFNRIEPEVDEETKRKKKEDKERKNNALLQHAARENALSHGFTTPGLFVNEDTLTGMLIASSYMDKVIESHSKSEYNVPVFKSDDSSAREHYIIELTNENIIPIVSNVKEQMLNEKIGGNLTYVENIIEDYNTKFGNF